MTAEARTGQGELEVQVDTSGEFRVYLSPRDGKGNIVAQGNVGDEPQHGRHFVAGDGGLRRMNPHGKLEEPQEDS